MIVGGIGIVAGVILISTVREPDVCADDVTADGGGDEEATHNNASTDGRRMSFNDTLPAAFVMLREESFNDSAGEVAYFDSKPHTANLDERKDEGREDADYKSDGVDVPKPSRKSSGSERLTEAPHERTPIVHGSVRQRKSSDHGIDSIVSARCAAVALSFCLIHL